jgi:MFS family permease
MPRRPTTAKKPDRGLDFLNLLVSAMGTAYGAYIAVYLTAMAWTQTRIGLVLTVATITSMAVQIPAGMLVDAIGPRRRRLLAAAVVVIGVTPLVLAAIPRELPVITIMALQAAAGTTMGPLIAAVSLAVAGRPGLGERLGRNARYGSIGAGLGAAVMGASSTWVGPHAVFFIAAAMMAPALFAVTRISADAEEETADAAAMPKDQTPPFLAPFALLRDRRILVFGLCLALYQLSSIAVMQLAAVETTARVGHNSGLVIAAFVIIPQVVVALIAPAVGRAAEQRGRRFVLLWSFATVPIRGALFALIRNPYFLIPVQTLEGAGGAAFGVMMPLIAADLTRRSKRYNLCLALFSLASTAGAAVSTVMAGFVADRYGRVAGFWALAAAGLLAFALVAAAFGDTRAGKRRG